MFAALAALALPAPAFAQPCLSYGPGRATLDGRLYAFEADAEGEGDITRTRRTDYYALVLTAPACVEGRSGDDPARTERHVTIVQLGSPPPRAKDLIGREVQAVGELAPARTAHHHTDVFMRVRSLQPLDGPN